MMGKRMTNVLSVLLAVLLVSVTFVPAVNAYSEEKAMESPMEGIKIEKITEQENIKEYYATAPLKNGTEQKFFVKQWKTEVDGKDVWKFGVYEVDSKGVVASQATFGRDSYYWWDSSGIHMHFGPIDMAALSTMSPTIIGAFGVWLGIAIGLSGGVAAIFAGVLATAVIISYWFYRNADGSIDVFLSNTTVALIPIYAILPGPQPIIVRLGTHDVILTI